MTAAKKSTQLVIVGICVFLIGAGLVFIGLRGGAKKAPAAVAKNATAQRQATADRVTQVRAAGQSTLAVTVPIPKGMQAVAVKLQHEAGLAGYAKPGDLLNLYATAKASSGKKLPLEAPWAKLILTGVKVLDVSGATAGTAAGDPVFLLALGPADAERVIFFAKFESLWATLAQEGQPQASTSGIDLGSALR